MLSVAFWLRIRRSCTTCPRVKGDASQRPNAPGARVERARLEVPPPRFCGWPIPPIASIMCSSSPNLPRSVSLRADQPVLVGHVVGPVRLLLRAMRGGLAFLRVGLPALAPLPVTGIRRPGCGVLAAKAIDVINEHAAIVFVGRRSCGALAAIVFVGRIVRT